MVANQFPGQSLEKQNDWLSLIGDSGKATGVVAFSNGISHQFSFNPLAYGLPTCIAITGIS